MAILAMSLVVFSLSLGVAIFGTSRESLYAEPGALQDKAPIVTRVDLGRAR